MKQVALTTIKGGLSRQRTKGGALPDALYDLLNAYVTTEKTVKSRPGTTLDETLPSGTFGLVYHDGAFQVFASSDVAGIPSGYNLNVLRAPDESALARIHFAEPFLGKLYVVAEFADGDTYHFWLRDSETWQADHEYQMASIVTPTTTNSYKYIPKRAAPPYPTWTPGAARASGDKVEPSAFNGYYFEVISTSGTNTRSGLVEPGWASDPDIVQGKRYVESNDGTYDLPKPTPAVDPTATPPLTTTDQKRYGRKRHGRNRKRWR